MHHRPELCTTNLLCAHVTKAWTYNTSNILMFDNEHANQGSQCSSVQTYSLVVHNVALYQLGGGQDDFACSLRTIREKVYNAVLSVSVSVRPSVHQ